MISNTRTNNHSYFTIMGLSWLETMKVNMLAGGEDTLAPLTLFQDHPRLSSRSPHAASTQRKTFNWVINYITNKTPSWFLPPLVFLFLFEVTFCSMVVACLFVVEGKVLYHKAGQPSLSFLFFSIWQTEPFQKPVSLEQHPDYAEYIFHPMDLCTLEKVQFKLPLFFLLEYESKKHYCQLDAFLFAPQNIKKKMYGCTEAFLADAKWILHNCIIYNGGMFH